MACPVVRLHPCSRGASLAPVEVRIPGTQTLVGDLRLACLGGMDTNMHLDPSFTAQTPLKPCRAVPGPKAAHWLMGNGPEIADQFVSAACSPRNAACQACSPPDTMACRTKQMQIDPHTCMRLDACVRPRGEVLSRPT